MLLLKTLKQHIQLALKNLFVSILLLACCIVLIADCITEQILPHGLGYLLAVWLCAYITDLVVNWKPKTSIGFPIKKPVRKELLVIFTCTALGLCFLVFRFTSDWDHLSGIVKLATLPFLLFAFPVVLGIIYLFVYKYKFKELGFNLNYWYLPLFLHIVFGVITLTVAPEKSHWREAWFELGIIFMIVEGFIGAALSEEFVRMLMQSRIGFAMKNMAFGIFIAAFIWSFMHVPVTLKNNPDTSTLMVFRGAIHLVPIGMLWGYITYRTKSLLPVLLMHGLNLWGLQNF